MFIRTSPGTLYTAKPLCRENVAHSAANPKVKLVVLRDNDGWLL